jgi:hypothetical protein
VLDQHRNRDVVRQPHVRSGESALGDLPAQRLDVLGDPRGQPVAELRIGVEPVQLMVCAGDLKRGPGDLRHPWQGRGCGRVSQPWPAPQERHQEDLGLRVQVQRQYRALTVGLGLAGRLRPAIGAGSSPGPAVPSGNRHRDLEPVVEHGA